MAMGILGQLVSSSANDLYHVYTVPVGKVAVFNIFTTCNNSNQYSLIYINNARISATAGAVNSEIKGIIGDAGTIVQFQGCTGIVTGYEEDA